MTMSNMSNMRLIDHVIVERTESWVGTPYRHQGFKKHVGCDCLGLIRGIWSEIYGHEPEKPEPYALNWAESTQDERMFEAAQRHCGPELSLNQLHPGCLILFRWQLSASMKHAGILTGPHQFIHAYDRSGVTQSTLVPSWRRRIAAVFEFPEL